MLNFLSAFSLINSGVKEILPFVLVNHHHFLGCI